MADSSHKVVLYVYDLSRGMARTFSRQFLGQQIDGIWHTGVIVYNQEYFYGGGINIAQPGLTPYGTPVQTIELGETMLPQDLFHEFLHEISSRFTPAHYDILRHNCNNFSNEVSSFLTGKPIPEFITGLPMEVMSTPMGRLLRPMLDQMQGQLVQYSQGHHLFNGQPMPSQPQPRSVPHVTAPSPPPISPIPNSPTFAVKAPGSNSHKHELLNLKAISFWRPVLIQNGNVPMIFGKLRQVIAEASLTLNADEINTLKALEDLTVLQENIATGVFSPAQIDLALKLLGLLPSDKSFPLLDILRIAICHPQCCNFFIQKGAEFTALLEKFASKTAPKAARIMAVRMAVNMFANIPGGQFMVSEAQGKKTLDLFVQAINAEEPQSRSAAAVLVYNMSLYLPRDDGEATTQCVTSVLHQLPQETDADSAFALLMALGHLLYGNDSAIEFVSLLGVDLDQWASKNIEKISGVIEDLRHLLK